MRCRCCEKVLEPLEIIWIPERHTHEDLCRRCRKMVFEDLESNPETKPSLFYVTDEVQDEEPEDDASE